MVSEASSTLPACRVDDPQCPEWREEAGRTELLQLVFVEGVCDEPCL